MNASNLNHADVLKGTTFSAPDSKGRVQISFVLPSGRKVTSTDWLVPEEIKGRVLIAWADAILAEDSFDITEREEKAKLARVEQEAQKLTSAALSSGSKGAPASARTASGPAGSSASPAAPSPSSSTSALPDNPMELVSAKLDTLTASRRKILDQLAGLTDDLRLVEQNISRWTVIAESLGISTPPAKTSVGSDSAATTSASGTSESKPSSTPKSTPARKGSRRLHRKLKGERRHDSKGSVAEGVHSGEPVERAVDSGDPVGPSSAGG